MRTLILSLSILGSSYLHAQTTFNSADVADAYIVNPLNWSNGLPSPSNPGTIPINAEMGTADLVGLEFTITSGATLTRGPNVLPELRTGTKILIEDGTFDVESGDGTRVLRIRFDSVLTLGANGTLKLPGNRNIEFFDSGSLVVEGGTATAEGIGVRDEGDHDFLTFGPGKGLVDLDDLISFDSTPSLYVNFLPGTEGKLDISSADESYYQGLWDASNLRLNGDNDGTFGDHFTVAGGILALAGVLADPILAVESSYSYTSDGEDLFPVIPLSNLGPNEDLVITSVTVAGPGVPYVSGLDYSTTIAAGGGAGEIIFDFFPPGPGNFDVTLSIFSNLSEPSPREIDVAIEVREPQIGVNTTKIDFGIVDASVVAGPLSFELSNDSLGFTDLTVAALTISGDPGFSTTATAPLTIAPQGSVPVELLFDPAGTSGISRGKLEVQSNDFFGTTVEVELVAYVEPEVEPAVRFDFGTASSPVQPGYTRFEAIEGGSMSQSGVTVTLSSKDGDIVGGSRGDDNDLRRDMAKTGATGATYLRLLITGLIDGTLHFITSHNLDGTGFSVPLDVLFGEEGGVLEEVATDVEREDWVSHSVVVEAGKVYELRCRERSSVNRAYLSSLLMSGSAVPDGADVYSDWASGFGLDVDWTTGDDPALDGRLLGNADPDFLINLLEFGFGLDPTVSDAMGLVVDEEGGVFTPGLPVTNVGTSPLAYSVRFVRLIDFEAAGLTYIPQFSSDMSLWDASTVAPTVILQDLSTGYEVVEVPYPFFASNGMKAAFFRIGVDYMP